MHRAPTLIAERKGSKGKRLLLIGHLDTVFPANSPFQKFKRNGAIFELARILNTMCAKLSDEKYLTFNPGLILGGTTINSVADTAFGKENVVAKMAVAKGDLRFLTPEQKQNAEKKISKIVDQHLPGTMAAIIFQDGIPSMPPTANNTALLKQYSDVSQQWGYGSVKALEPGSRGAGDISFVASIVAANLAGLGPEGYGAHSAEERLNIPTLWMQTQRAAGLIYQLTL